MKAKSSFTPLQISSSGRFCLIAHVLMVTHVSWGSSEFHLTPATQGSEEDERNAS